MTPGEQVSVLIYRLFLYNQETVRLVENKSLRDENPVYI